MTEISKLLHWVRGWEVINSGLVRFTRCSHVLFPFLFNAHMNVTRDTPPINSTQVDLAEMEESRSTEGEQIEERDWASPSAEAAELRNLSDLYAQVYAMLSVYVKIGYWSNAVLVQHLLASSVGAWVQQLCSFSGGRLRVPPEDPVIDEMSPSELVWPSEEIETVWERVLRNNYEPWRGGKCVGRPQQLCHCHPTNKEIHNSNRGVNGASYTKHLNCTDSSTDRRSKVTNENLSKGVDRERMGPGDVNGQQEPSSVEEDILFLYTLVTFASHFNRMRWLLKVVFLRLNVEFSDIAWRILRSSVKTILEYNRDTIQDMLCRTAECYVLDSLCDSGMEAPSASDDASGELLLLASRCPCPSCGYCPFGEEDLKRIRRYSFSRISWVFQLMDECGGNESVNSVREHVVHCCKQGGNALAATQLGPLCEQETPDSWCAGQVDGLHKVSGALSTCMNTYTRLRGSLLRLFGATNHCHEDACKRVSAAVRAFFIGFCEKDVLLNFVGKWGLPLWLRACEEEHDRRNDAVTVALHTTQRWDPQTGPSESSNTSIYRPLASTFSQQNDGKGHNGNVNYNLTGRGNYHFNGLRVPLRPGFVMLIFFFSPEVGSLTDIEACLASLVRRHLEFMLRTAQGGSSPQLQAMPQDVYQRCVFFFRLTNQMLEPMASAGCTGASVTLRALRRGMQEFFTAREPSAILTLAGALYAQMAGKSTCSSPGHHDDTSGECSAAKCFETDGNGGTCSSRLEIVDTILEMVALLRSKDLFVDCYCGLLAPRFMSVKDPGELDVDEDVITRLALHLGDSIASQPFALLRDTRIGLAGPLGSPRLVQFGRLPQAGCAAVVFQARVLCGKRWSKYVSVTIKSSEMCKHLDEGHWFSTAMTDAIQAFERDYDASFAVGPTECTEKEPPSRGSWSTVIFGHNALLRTDSRSSDGATASNTRNSHTSPISTAQRTKTLTMIPQRQKRILLWSIGSGSLTIVCHPSLKANEPRQSNNNRSVQVVVPPVGLLVLQALERHGTEAVAASSATSMESPLCTFDFLHRSLPVNVPKSLLGAVLGGFVRNRVVVRTVCNAGQSKPGISQSELINTYSLPQSFSACKKRKVVIDLSNASHHWVPFTQFEAVQSKSNPSTECSSSSVKAVSGIVEVERMKKLEAGVIRVMKTQRSLSHAELFSEVEQLLNAHFVLTAPLLKKCVEQLIERDFIARGDRDTYVYVA
ncbi:hypothetical protein TRVL_06484 [Trypanosoma vivax]|nr:hypothetical protein TRVL_06484 [Trypanosoma vivax]